MLPEGTVIEFHTHDTAGMGVACNYAAIEGGADIIDLAMAPVSGGTAEVDILTMWQRLRGTDYTLDIDHEKYIEVEALFMNQMDKYYMPPEAKEVNPLIPFSPMPGGALTANTQMMRDTNSLHLFPEVIRNMREVVAKGGFGSSVTPVSQFYFQQAFANTVQGEWKKITDSYGKMVLGYFGRTPAEPDPEVVRLASEQLGLQPTTEDVHDINDRNPELGIAYNRQLLEKAGLPVTEENIFISATCGAKGISFLKGDKPLGIRFKADVEAEAAAKAAPKNASSPTVSTAKPAKSGMSNYIITVDGKSYNVSVADGTGAVKSAAPAVPAAAAPQAQAAGEGTPVETSLPGTVMAIEVEVGDTVREGDDVVIIEAMKMESPVKATKSGRVVSIDVAVGDTVATGDVLLYIA